MRAKQIRDVCRIRTAERSLPRHGLNFTVWRAYANGMFFVAEGPEISN
jgi:hypothetical protein